ncbi:MAG TPA: hypothetical protein VJZ06_01635 [Mobilitalea sp.]|nr:hypothetical protein [Mobilitalea sp.]
MMAGVYSARKKDGNVYFRASITYRGKHISLGSFKEESEANNAYHIAGEILANTDRWNIPNYPAHCILSHHKWVVLINLRDNHIYFKNPIYLRKKYFIYYINKDTPLKFDVEDLFYYAHHKILKRGGHLFASDYGMQVNILSRYGIKNYAVPGRDYIFSNGDSTDFRYSNIEIINPYHGVTRITCKEQYIYLAKIHINGDFLVGRYHTEKEAAVAYNKAALILRGKGIKKNFPQNYIEGIDEIAYASMHQRIRISKKILDL